MDLVDKFRKFPDVVVEVNGGRLKPFMLSRSIYQGYPLLLMQYILALEPFLCKLNVNPVLDGITLPGLNILVRYSAYADDIITFVKSNTEIDEVGKKISRSEEVTGVKINCAVGCVEGIFASWTL